MTQAEVARAIGTGQPRIAAIETGRQKPGRSLAIRLAKLFEIPIPEKLIEDVIIEQVDSCG